jgi:hypothetical protein
MTRELSGPANKVGDTSKLHFLKEKNISDAECQRKIEYITGINANEAKHQKEDTAGYHI